ncbi:30512_t:CDS:2, partial [Gigaspora margarita]
LKKEVLKKKYQQIRAEIKQKEKAQVAQENQELRNSLLPSLLYFAQMNSESLSSQEYRLSKETFHEKADWVSAGAITNNSKSKEKEAVKKAIKQLSDDKISLEQQNNRMNLLLNNYPKKYLELVAAREARELERKVKYLASLSSSKSSGTIAATPNITFLEEKFERLADAYEKMREYIEEKGVFVEAQENIVPEQPGTTSTTDNLYDDLFADLDQEEAERLRRKRAKDAAKKKLEEQEFARRQSNLSEKDRKLAEEAEKRQREKELEEQEAEAARKRQEEREKNLNEDRQTYLDNETKRIQEAKERAEKELSFQEEQMRKEKEKKEQEIQELKDKNKQEEERLTQEKELMEKELAEELARIDVNDRERRQKIENEFEKRKLKIKEDMDELKAKTEKELNEKKAAAEKEAQENEIKLKGIRDEIQIQNDQAERARTAAAAQERLLRDERDKANALRKYRSQLYDYVMEYVFTEEEGRKGTRNPQKGYGTLRMFLDDSPGMEFNLDFGDIADVNRTSTTYRRAIEIFRKVAGNRFVTKGELRNLIEEKVQSLDFI